MISPPLADTLRRNRLTTFELRIEKGSYDVTRQIRRSDIEPSVTRDLGALELCAISALLPDDLGTSEGRRVIHHQCAALTRDNILGFVEAECRKVTEGTERFALVFCKQPLRGIFNYFKSVMICDHHDCVHYGAHAGVVNYADRFGSRRNGRRDQI